MSSETDSKMIDATAGSRDEYATNATFCSSIPLVASRVR